jgi:hypothetical protein
MIRRINNNQSKHRRVFESLQPLEDFESDVIISRLQELINVANGVVDELEDYKSDVLRARKYDASDVNYALRNALQSLDNCSTYLSYLRTALH